MLNEMTGIKLSVKVEVKKVRIAAKTTFSLRNNNSNTLAFLIRQKDSDSRRIGVFLLNIDAIKHF